MDVRKLIAEQFIVDLHRIKHDCQRLRDFRHLFNELTSLFTGEVKQLGRVPLEHQHRPTREELILVKIRDREIQINDLMVLERPRARAGFAGHASRTSTRSPTPAFTRSVARPLLVNSSSRSSLLINADNVRDGECA